MSVVFLAWRQPDRRWWPVGRLTREEGDFVFRYTRGALDAMSAGFRPLLSFPDVEATYASRELFPTFTNRLVAPGRAEEADFSRWLGLPSDEKDPLVLLARSGGRRETDSYELFAAPVPNAGMYRMDFFVHGISHRDGAAHEVAAGLDPGDRLLLEPDPQNPADTQAIKVLSGKRIHLGFVPRYLCADFGALGAFSAGISVVRVNPPPTPLQFRVLASYETLWPQGFAPFGGDLFLPLESQVAAVA